MREKPDRWIKVFLRGKEILHLEFREFLKSKERSKDVKKYGGRCMYKEC